MKYEIQFFDYWHLSSGMSAGSALDSLVVKENSLPYLPGKTLKGLLREMVEIIEPQKVKSIFGDEGSQIANSYFSNATLDEATALHLQKNPHLIKHLYSKLTATKIDSHGIADDKSLREIEVTIPLTLSGTIECSDKELIKSAMSMIKQIGLNRNRGLGRCQIREVKDDN